MAKTKKEVELTPEEKALRDAQALLQYRAEIKRMTAECKAVEERLEAYCTEYGTKDIGGLLMATQRLNPPKLVGAEGKRKEMLIERLLKELPTMYVKESKGLDLGRMLASIDVDPALRAMLKEAELQLVQETSFVFKAV